MATSSGAVMPKSTCFLSKFKMVIFMSSPILKLLPCFKMQKILSDEDEEFLEFAIDNLEELSSYIINKKLNIRIHRDITGEMWFGVG